MNRSRTISAESPAPAQASTSEPPAPPASRYRIERYSGRSWAAYEDKELIAVTLYKRGAQAIVDRLESLEHQLAELRQRLADQVTPPEPQPAPPRFQERIRPVEQRQLLDKHPRYRVTHRPQSAHGR
jgi:hypothetical protein